MAANTAVLVEDPLAQACASNLRPILEELGYAGIVSLGLPRVLYPHMDLVKDWPIQIFEKEWDDSYNFGLGLSWREYQYRTLQELESVGFRLGGGSHVVGDDVRHWKYYWPDVMEQEWEKPTKFLMLLDTCQINHLQAMTRTDAKAPVDSIYLFNTCDRRVPGRVQVYAEQLLREPELISSVEYEPRKSGPTRLISLYKELA